MYRSKSGCAIRRACCAIAARPMDRAFITRSFMRPTAALVVPRFLDSIKWSRSASIEVGEILRSFVCGVSLLAEH
eukprot:scaffold5008_cov69-Phaeocystis_antarctica.AAC.8